MYLKVVDTFNDLTISAFVTAGHQKVLLFSYRDCHSWRSPFQLVLLHDARLDENSIKSKLKEGREIKPHVVTLHRLLLRSVRAVHQSSHEPFL
jgi:hypothetical protein